MAGDRTNVVITGPTVLLDPRGALALGMAVHELATNAAKFGALSVPEGDVAVTWDVERTEDGEHLHLDWVERNGPPVKEPAKRGFGSMLIERALSHDLSGKAKIEFLPEGVRAIVRAPLPAKTADTPAVAMADRVMPPKLAGKRVLVVEDEMLVALWWRTCWPTRTDRRRPVRACPWMRLRPRRPRWWMWPCWT